MSQGRQRSTVPAVIKRKPVQAGRFVAILLVLVLGIGGFLRVISAEGIVNYPLLGDGQLLALVFIPLLGLGLTLLGSSRRSSPGIASFGRTRPSEPRSPDGGGIC